jgi:hypothetical protein
MIHECRNREFEGWPVWVTTLIFVWTDWEESRKPIYPPSIYGGFVVDILALVYYFIGLLNFPCKRHFINTPYPFF